MEIFSIREGLRDTRTLLNIIHAVAPPLNEEFNSPSEELEAYANRTCTCQLLPIHILTGKAYIFTKITKPKHQKFTKLNINKIKETKNVNRFKKLVFCSILMYMHFLFLHFLIFC